MCHRSHRSYPCTLGLVQWINYFLWKLKLIYCHLLLKIIWCWITWYYDTICTLKTMRFLYRLFIYWIFFNMQYMEINSCILKICLGGLLTIIEQLQMLFDRLKLLLSFVKQHLLTVWSGYIGLEEVTHHKRYQCLDKPNCHVVPGAHDVSPFKLVSLFWFVRRLIRKMKILMYVYGTRIK